MATIQEILRYLQTLAPTEYKEEWDNVGLLCGRGGQRVRRAVIALDPFMDTVQEAIREQAQLVITHHPLMFSTKTVSDETEAGRVLLAMIENGIGAIAVHTNLDSALGGVNDCLAQVLGLEACQVLDPEGTDEEGRVYGHGRVGTVAPRPLEDFLALVKERLHCQGLRYASGGRPVHKVAVGGGACAGYLDKVAALGCDTFVTGDVKYNGFADAADLGITMIDAGHFPTENPVCAYLVEKLTHAFPEVRFSLSKDHEDVVKFF